MFLSQLSLFFFFSSSLFFFRFDFFFFSFFFLIWIVWRNGGQHLNIKLAFRQMDKLWVDPLIPFPLKKTNKKKTKTYYFSSYLIWYVWFSFYIPRCCCCCCCKYLAFLPKIGDGWLAKCFQFQPIRGKRRFTMTFLLYFQRATQPPVRNEYIITLNNTEGISKNMCRYWELIRYGRRQVIWCAWCSQPWNGNCKI